jgi:hypothetical protein
MFNLDDDTWYQPCVRKQCPDCEEKEFTFSRAQRYMQETLLQLYGKEPINIHKLEENLDELCYLLGVKFIPEDLQIERKQAKNKFLTLNLGYTHASI